MSTDILKLIRAIEHDNIRETESLLKPGFLRKAADLNQPIPGGHTALMTAARKGNAQIVGMLLGAGANVDAKAEDGRTALMIAVENGNHESAALLLSAVADVDAKTNDHRFEHVRSSVTSGGQSYSSTQEKTVFVGNTTALMLAIGRGDERMVSLILDRKPDVGLRRSDGKTALALAIERQDRRTITHLLQCGAVLNLAETISDNDVRCRSMDQSQVDLIRFLLGSGADPNARAGGGTPALTWAMDLHHLPVVCLLVESGADVNATDDDGETVLFHLARHGTSDDAPVLEYLCQHGLDVNIANKAGEFSSIHASDALCVFTRILIRAGARYIPGDSQSLFVQAIDGHDQSIVEHLLRNGADTAWNQERQDEDQFGSYSVSDHYDMRDYARTKKADGILQLLEQPRTSKRSRRDGRRNS